MIELTLPLEVFSPNQKMHWAKQYAHDKNTKNLIGYYWNTLPNKPKPPCTVKIQRECSGRCKIMDDDNFISSCKAIRDAIADRLIPGLAPGHADSTDKIKWEYTQLRSKANTFTIRIEELI